jgi:TRAP-type mannitol/chloroaromatic compound transport system permease large subunit
MMCEKTDSQPSPGDCRQQMSFLLRIPMLAAAIRAFLSNESKLASILLLLILIYVPYCTYMGYVLNRTKFRDHEVVNTPSKAFGVALLASVLQLSASVLVGSVVGKAAAFVVR